MEVETIIRGVVTKTSVFADLIALQTHQSKMADAFHNLRNEMCEMEKLLKENLAFIDELERTINIDNEYSKPPL